jgi:hypothetical protein
MAEHVYRRRALVVAVEVLSLVGRCKKAFPSAYEYTTSEMIVAGEELIESEFHRCVRP